RTPDSHYFSSACSVPIRFLHSFPTRRSSDLESRLSRGSARVVHHRLGVTAAGVQSSARPSSPGDPSRKGHSANCGGLHDRQPARDRKSTRLNSSHDQISYAVFCLKKKIRKPS